MKNYFLIAIVITSLLCKVNAQNFIFDLNDLSSKPLSSIQIYDESKNPALLNFDTDDERLNISSFYNSSKNRIKRTFVPTEENFIQIQFSGKKKIDNNQIFKGIFAFNKLIRKNWDWVFTKDFRSGNPFLLGDSSSGNSTFNGIYFDANYFNNLSERFSIGAGLEYFVDEGLKQVSPKPTSQHRDILFRIGSSYDFSNYLIAGILIQLEDKKEEISYREDEGAVYKEITLLKFRGVDLPISIKKKTENRIAFLNGFSIASDLIYSPLKSFKVFANVRKGIEQILQKEEITNPQNQGYFQNDYLRAKLNSQLKLSETLSSSIGIEYFNSSSWSRHPNFFSVVSDNDQTFISVKGTLNYQLSSKLSFGLGTGLGQLRMKLNDYYSNVLFDLSSNLFMLLNEFDFKFTEIVGLKTFLIFENYKPRKAELWFFNPSAYFINFFSKDFEYFSTEFFKYELGLSTILNTIFGEFDFDLFYIYYEPRNSSPKLKNYNSDLRTILSYRVKVY